MKSIPAAFAAVLFGAFPARAQLPRPWQLGMQDPASPTMEMIRGLNDTLNLIIVAITVLVLGLVAFILWRFRASRNPEPARWSHNTVLELAWTTLPVLILVAIAFPSFRLLYYMDRAQKADMTIKITGHQWYWSYEYPDHGVTFDANMIQDADLKPGQPRMLATDNHVVVPVGAAVRLQMTADDVIHSWAVPALGVKTDTVPGRLNESWFQATRAGIWYGMCSELCGVNHAFMPITVEAVPPDQFQDWTKRMRAAASGATALARAEEGQ